MACKLLTIRLTNGVTSLFFRKLKSINLLKPALLMILINNKTPQ